MAKDLLLFLLAPDNHDWMKPGVHFLTTQAIIHFCGVHLQLSAGVAESIQSRVLLLWSVPSK